MRLKLVPLELCTDNAAMIGSAARFAAPHRLSRLPRLRRLRQRRNRAAGRRTEPMASVVVYSRPGCHLCEEAMAADRRPARGGLPLRAARGRHRERRAAAAPPPRADPGGRGRRRSVVSELVLDRDRRCGPGSILWGHGRGDRGVRRRRGVPGRRRAPLAGRRRAPLPLPAGADPGAQDGPGDDLLAGALRVHPHQPDPDPPRPLRLRQVRQARRRLQRRVAGLGDPQDPPHLRPAQHRPLRRRQPRPGDRQLRDLRRPRLPGRRHLRRRPERRRHPDRRAAGARLRRPARRSSPRRRSSSASSRCPPRPPRTSPTASSRPG